MSDEILIRDAYLETLAANASTAAEMLRQNSEFTSLAFSPNHEVTEAYGTFAEKWRKNREGLQQGLDAVSQAFASTREAFMKADSDLADAASG